MTEIALAVVIFVSGAATGAVAAALARVVRDDARLQLAYRPRLGRCPVCDVDEDMFCAASCTLDDPYSYV